MSEPSLSSHLVTFHANANGKPTIDLDSLKALGANLHADGLSTQEAKFVNSLIKDRALSIA